MNYEEQKTLKLLLENKLKQKEESLFEDMSNISDTKVQDIEEFKKTFVNSELDSHNVITQENKLRELQTEFIKSTLKLGEHLTALLDLRNNIVPKVMENKSGHLLLEQEKINFRLRILEIKTDISLFNDSHMSLQAYRIAYKDMKNRQDSYIKEIDSLESDIKKFKTLLKNKEFEEILEKYKQYVNAMEKLKWLN